MAFVLESILNRRWTFALLAAVAALALLLSACGGDDEEDEHDGMAMASGTAEAHDEEEDEEDEHDGMAMASGTAEMAMATGEHDAHDDTAMGVVHPKPAGATEVRVTLAEWTLELSVSSVPAGDIYFLVDNLGPEHPHEFVIIRSDLAADALPTIHDGSVPEDAVELVGEIEEFASASSASMVFNLTAGKYVLICTSSRPKGTWRATTARA